MQGLSADSERAYRVSDEAAGDPQEPPAPLYGDPEPPLAEDDGEMAEEVIAGTTEHQGGAQRQRAEWMNMFQIRVRPQDAWVPEQDR